MKIEIKKWSIDIEASEAEGFAFIFMALMFTSASFVAVPWLFKAFGL